ncbi:TIGR03751 family conjugal transfer lipoprotein [Yersinia enterocolitica]|uniref:Lipoprotein n=1 Tax=Yersinia enterocolitica serotype O:8 / biotype 1B (strain NCTC 13174 / 8081) TaxID=393305 RepID=A1JQ06_YERE8|nr:putative lipoprotein [Yersinia enterocolitica subsp. enterocolitica 8081]
MMKKSIKFAFIPLLLTVVMLMGCSTSKDQMLPPGGSTMLTLWNDSSSATHATREGRTTLRRTLMEPLDLVTETGSRIQENEIQHTFPRLPNPDLVMFVYPHFAGRHTPVPGYSTVLPLYSQVQYALPGERTAGL